MSSDGTGGRFMATTNRRPTRRTSRAAATVHAPEVGNLAACVEDVRRAALDLAQGPEEPTDFDLLRGRLETARSRFPPLYRDGFTDPFVRHLDALGRTGFTQILLDD